MDLPHPTMARHVVTGTVTRGPDMAEDASSPQQQLGELFELTKSYARQETVDPIKGLGKFIGYGVGAAVMGAMAVGLLVLGLLRLLQTETGAHLTGSLTWVPYLVTLVVAAIVAAIAARAISAKKGNGR